ncbi:hypothetical protein E7681_11085 [Thalassobius vesicularis]|uniref:Uncharacterized protein n=1 Tax=Thalassobius vesicularis TaxID=1294297 RepID=A0A4S3M7B3_9RHOB|nr:hypothetical protein [Thalassobius vesicularis]THD73240.1 hypothetical protein E7681_11085 [Thalassobius vesicularis]
MCAETNCCGDTNNILRPLARRRHRGEQVQLQPVGKGAHQLGRAVQVDAAKKELGLDFFAKMKARMAESGPTPLGLQLVMGATSKSWWAPLRAGSDARMQRPILFRVMPHGRLFWHTSA